MDEFNSAYYISAILVLIISVVLYIVQKYTYWSRKGVEQATPVPFFGNFTQFALQQKSLSDEVTKIYKQFRSLPYVGAYFLNNNLLVVRDPDLIKNVMAKDFYHFNSRGLAFDRTDKFALHLFTSDGDDWKIWRQNLTPLFTSSKMKNMMYLMVESSKRLTSYLEETVRKDKTVDIRKLNADFTIEVIGSCAFGLQMNSMNEDNNIFRTVARKIIQTSVKKSLSDLLGFMFPSVYKALSFRAIDTSVETFLVNIYKKLNESRKGQHATRHDFVDLLMEIRSRGFIEGDSLDKRNKTKVKLDITDIDMASQMFVFFAAGFETSATTMSFALYELAKNRHIQTKLREEINTQLKETNGEITYEILTKMNYLDMAIDETLRMYPVLGILNRQCTSKYTLPGTDVVIDKGVDIHIPLMAIQHDPQYYPNPEQFNPDNFLPEVVAARHPYTYMPFGEGPRICIGLRFAKMQMKVGLITLLRQYDIFKSEKTQEKLSFNPKNFLTEPIGGIHLNVVPLVNAH